jgi:poly(3-hydroxybutyrate) depolymerase
VALIVCSAGLLWPVESDARDKMAPNLAIPASFAGPAATGRPTLADDAVYLAPTIDPSSPVTVLLALHGYSGSGSAIAARLRTCADEYGWALVAPTMVYRDYFDPDQLRADARDNLPEVHAMLDALRAGVGGMDLEQRVLLYGFSRGAQMAQRFALAYPGEVAAVAALSAGSYTLPERQDGTDRPLRFPFGIADLPDVGLARFDGSLFGTIPFWVGVGGEDVNPADTSRAWDTYEGLTRVDRARAFAAHLQRHGNPVELHVFGGAGHEETGSMRASACAFLAAAD